MYRKDYEESIQAKTAGTLRVNFSNNYHKGRKYTLTLYFPAYSVTKMMSINGMIIVTIQFQSVPDRRGREYCVDTG